MALTFHIIYTAGTVKPLQLLLYSLLKWSDCTFRLVANGCSRAEQATLQRLCASNPRLSCVTLPTQKVMVHGEALNYLQEQNQTDYFCFLDSDIYAVGEFLPTLLPDVSKVVGIFSAATFSDLPQDRVSPIGEYMPIQQRVYIGTTFLAIYNNAVITETRRATGIGFTPCRWEALAELYQKPIAAMGAKRDYYDTAKLLNLMMHLSGHALQHQPCPTLRHIGGLSRFSGTRPRSWWQRWRAWGGRWRRKLAGQKVAPSFSAETPYLAQLLLALADNKVVPKPPAAHATPDHAWVTRTTAELMALHAEFAKL